MELIFSFLSLSFPQVCLGLTRTGIVVDVRGENAHLHRLDEEKRDVLMGEAVFFGDAFVTGPNTKIKLELDARRKHFVTLFEDSQLNITKEFLNEFIGPTLLELLGGYLRATVRHLQRGETIEFRTPNATVGIRGTDLLLSTAAVASMKGIGWLKIKGREDEIIVHEESCRQFAQPDKELPIYSCFKGDIMPLWREKIPLCPPSIFRSECSPDPF